MNYEVVLVQINPLLCALNLPKRNTNRKGLVLLYNVTTMVSLHHHVVVVVVVRSYALLLLLLLYHSEKAVVSIIIVDSSSFLGLRVG